METKDLLKFIEEYGFRSMEEIKKNFSHEDPEVMETQLSYMASRNSIRKVSYQNGAGVVGDLYYTPK